MIKHIHLNECDSTQDLIKEQLIHENGLGHILVSCENQTAGRGRGSNSWITMPGTLSFSLSLSPHPQSSFTALEISLLVTRFFDTKGRHLKMKWPNDIYNSELKKCGGVLVQSSRDKTYAGIGINLFSQDTSFGGVYEASFEIDKKKWAKEMALYILDNRITDTENLTEEWEKKCFHLQTPVSISESSESFYGLFIGLGTHGEALLKNEQGIQHVYNGTLRMT